MRGLMPRMSNLLLEMFVLSKPYFDREGLIVAVDDQAAEDPIQGFVHAGFGPNQQHSGIDTSLGITCLLAVRRTEQRHEILAGLLEQSEAYLKERGAQRLQLGGAFPHSPFYLGVCGGSDLQAVSDEDHDLIQLCQAFGYAPVEHSIFWERNIHRFRPPMDRRLIQHRRRYRLAPALNPDSMSWWESCVYGPTDRIVFGLEAKSDGARCGEIGFWDMGPLSTRPHFGGMGILRIDIDDDNRGKGLGLFLMSEALRHLQGSNVMRVEGRARSDDAGAKRILEKLGFSAFGSSSIYQKSLAGTV